MTRLNANMLIAAERYIASDKSDPFTRNRVLSHIRNGVAKPNDYDAEETKEHREYKASDGVTVRYTVPSFKDIKRP